MSKKILQNYDFVGNSLIDFRVENLASFPTAGKAGRMVFSTGTSQMGYDDGTVFVPFLTSVAWTDITGKPTTFAPSAHTHAIADVTGLQGALDLKAPLASPAFTGSPTAPTPAVADNSTKIATTEFVQDVVVNLGAGDMLKSIYDTGNNGKVDVAELAEAVAWADVTGKPATFAPSAHNHTISEVTGLQAALDAKADSSHTHTASEITDFQTEVRNEVAAYWDVIAGTDANADTIRETLDLILANAGSLQDQIQRYNADIGDGSATSISVTHSLNSLDVTVEVYDKSTGETVGVGVTRTNANVVTIEAIPAPASNALRVVVKK